ncbi:hypothetical protein Ae201684P_001283 [Aphanomyces euteiches]|uniref:Uncharacterized protein n=1 Tax=Aphanomyces euteiches TaxID=100861 RepID=A0A6G0WGU8_9STRA|nr:hypothetical protein Ae201684_015387 [Aphanomyces euteiches]KAH9097808.1 hypothetical protein Ae201684P_001283 [Aphanomyces euteiches]
MTGQHTNYYINYFSVYFPILIIQFTFLLSCATIFAVRCFVVPCAAVAALLRQKKTADITSNNLSSSKVSNLSRYTSSLMLNVKAQRIQRNTCREPTVASIKSDKCPPRYMQSLDPPSST